MGLLLYMFLIIANGLAIIFALCITISAYSFKRFVLSLGLTMLATIIINSGINWEQYSLLSINAINSCVLLLTSCIIYIACSFILFAMGGGSEKLH